MANLDLTKYGITGTTEIVYNPSYEVLFAEENRPELEGFEKGKLTELDAMNVMTGIYTGRSPKDKYIVMDENSKDTVWWTTEGYKNDNHPLSEENWAKLKELGCRMGPSVRVGRIEDTTMLLYREEDALQCLCLSAGENLKGKLTEPWKS